MYGPSYTRYHARDWAEGKTREQIEAEIAAVEHVARTHHFQWNEVGNVSDCWTRAETLREILAERKN